MTGDELYALGYALQYSCWGVHVILEDAAHMDDEPKAVHTFFFPDGPISTEEAVRRGWEFAAAHFVAARLA